MRRLLVAVVLGLVVSGGGPPRAAAADPAAITSAAAFPRIESRVSISKAIDPSRNIRTVADDLRATDRSAQPGVTAFDERVKSFAEDPGGPTILLDDLTHGFDPTRPVDGVIGKFSGSSDVSQHTTVAATADTVSVASSANLVCRKTRIPDNALMAAFPTGFSDVTVNIQIARPCRYSLTAAVSADPDDGVFGSGDVVFTISGADPLGLPDGNRQLRVEPRGSAHSAHSSGPGTQSLHLAGVFQPGFVSLSMVAQLTQSGPEGRASWSVSLELSADEPTDEIRWKKPRNGTLAAVSNWEPPFVPTDDGVTRNETAVFDRSGTYTVDFATATKALGPATTWERHRQRSGRVRFAHADLTLTATSLADPSFLVDGGASLTLEDCHLTSQHATLGDQRFGYVLVDLDGPNTVWNCLGTLVVGGAGGTDSAELGVNLGARLTSGPAAIGEGGERGYVQVFGDGATWTSGDVDVGIIGEGTVDLAVDARWTSGNVSIGNSPSGRGLVNVRSTNRAEPASEWVGGDVVVGNGGPGELRVADGCSASVEDVTVGASSRGECRVEGVAIVSVRPSALICRSLELGFLADLHVTGGAVLTVSDEMQVDGSFAYVSGSDIATGLRSTLTVGATLILGGPGHLGGIFVEPGAQMTCGSAILGPAPSPFSGGHLSIGDGSASVVAAECRVLGDLVVGQHPAGGRVELKPPATLTVGGTLSVSPSSSLLGAGTVTVGGALELDGTISAGISILARPAKGAPGAKPAPPVGGTLTIDGDLVVGPTGVVLAEAAGPEASRLVVTGDTTLGGTLVLQFRNGFAPRAGDPFEVLQANGTVTGDFASVAVRGLAPGAQFDVAKSGTKWVATAAADTVALPTVSVKASPKKLLEKKPKKKGALTFARSGDTSAPLTVAYSVGGTAENGVDCVQLLGSVTFPARKKSVKVPVEVANDPFREDAETLEVSVVSGADYTASLASTARFAIVDSLAR